MDREILFRGKRIDNEEWIEGKLLVDNLIVPVNLEFKVKVGCIYGYEVIPETVGQYTGLCDKNGVKIFEGDIVVWDYDKVDFDGATHSTPELVRWDKDYCGFIVNYDDMGTIDKNCRVIGNIYDNPGLLEEENETD